MDVDMRLLKAKLKYHDRTYTEIAESLGINRDTFSKRLATGKFTLRDIHKMMKSVPLTMEEVEAIFFVKNRMR